MGLPNYDNSAVMLLNLLRSIGVENIVIAGLDGYTGNTGDNYSDEVFSHTLSINDNYESHNEELKALLKNYRNTLQEKQSVRFLTPSRFESIFEDAQ